VVFHVAVCTQHDALIELYPYLFPTETVFPRNLEFLLRWIFVVKRQSSLGLVVPAPTARPPHVRYAPLLQGEPSGVDPAAIAPFKSVALFSLGVEIVLPRTPRTYASYDLTDDLRRISGVVTPERRTIQAVFSAGQDPLFPVNHGLVWETT
jgi:hypothetical protein